MIRVTRVFTFHASPLFYNYDGKSRDLNGHPYKLYVTVKGNPISNPDDPKNGMVIDFVDLDNIVKEQVIEPWDEGVFVNALSPHKATGEVMENQGRNVIYCDYQPTCENMLYDIAKRIQGRLGNGVDLDYLKLVESKTSYTEWFREDQ